jgi:hypothetical protein
VRILVEQLDDLASHGQLWLDTFRIMVRSGAGRTG